VPDGCVRVSLCGHDGCDGFFLRLDALAMTNQPNDIHYHAVVRTPWRLSFQSSSAASVSSDFTATSSSSIRGLNSFTSKALFAFGEATLRRATAIVIQTRLRKLKSQFPHKDSYESPNLPVFYRDVLELTRPGLYNPQIRKKALRLVLGQICNGNTRHLLDYLPGWPMVEIALFLREVMLCMPSNLTSLEAFQQPMHIELMELNFESLVEVMWAVQFFAQVIVNLGDGAQAFIEAEGPDVILALNKASPPDLNFFHIHTLDGPQPYIWGNAAKILSQYPATAAHDLLAVLRKDSPSLFPTSREFVKEAKAKMKSQAKVLLMGSQESGKEALLKQIRLLSEGGFSYEETERFRVQIFNNLIHGLKDILSSHLDLSAAISPDNLRNAELLANAQDAEFFVPFPAYLREPLRKLWKDPACETWKMWNNDTLKLSYYFQHLDRLFNPSYLPNSEDILHCLYSPTAGITETVFKTADSKLIIFDIGGQNTEARKLMYPFQDVTCVVFVVDLSGYDQVQGENNNENQMQHAMNMWESITHSQWFRNNSFLLFLNNRDIFDTKIAYSDIRNHFPDYTGSTGDIYEGLEYFKSRFIQIAKDGNTKSPYVCGMTAVDTALTEMLDIVQDIALARVYQAI